MSVPKISERRLIMAKCQQEALAAERAKEWKKAERAWKDAAEFSDGSTEVERHHYLSREAFIKRARAKFTVVKGGRP